MSMMFLCNFARTLDLLMVCQRNEDGLKKRTPKPSRVGLALNRWIICRVNTSRDQQVLGYWTVIHWGVTLYSTMAMIVFRIRYRLVIQ